MRPSPYFAAAAAACFLSGCATSSVTQFYHPVPNRLAGTPTASDPEIRPGSGDAKEDSASFAEEGWELLGYSAFNGPQASPAMLSAQAKKVGATLVVVGSKYMGTQSTGAVGSTTFTRYGAFSFAVPTSVERYSQYDLFYARAPRIGIGAIGVNLTPQEHADIGTNRGVRIRAVVNGSPASEAEVLPGDVVISIDKSPVYDNRELRDRVQASYGKSIDLTILRKGQEIHKIVNLPQGGVWSSAPSGAGAD